MSKKATRRTDDDPPQPRIDIADDPELSKLDKLPDPDAEEEKPPNLEALPPQKREQVSSAWNQRKKRALRYVYDLDPDED